MDKQLKELKGQYKSAIPTHFTDQDKQAVLRKIKLINQTKRPKKKRFFPFTLTSAVLVAVVFLSVLISDVPFTKYIANKSDKSGPENMPMTTRNFNHDYDANTQSPFANDMPPLKKITPAENDLLIDWSYDNMDRGNDDYDSSVHGALVIRENDVTDIERGDVIYFITPNFDVHTVKMRVSDQQISRIVGLPGETVEIKEGHIYIDGQPLDTFYGQPPIRNGNEGNYTIDLDPIQVNSDSVFVLGDQWWKSIDSKDFGPLPIHDIIGEVIGYQK